MDGAQASGLLAPRVPVCRPRLRASGRLGGVPGARGWRGPGALHVRPPSSGPIKQNSDFVQVALQKMDVLGAKRPKMLHIWGVYGCTHPINHG